MKMIPAFSLALAACLLAACQQQKAPEPDKKEAATELPPLHLGAVHQVYPEQGFALLRIIGPMPKAGTTLITHPADGSTVRIGNLVISAGQPARNGIIAADIRSGTVAKGDRVFQYRDVALHPGKEQEPVTGEENPATAEGTPPSVPAPGNEPLPGGEPLPEASSAPVEEPAAAAPAEGIDVTLLPNNEPAAGSSPRPIVPPAEVPDYLKDIPSDIKGWE